MRVFLLTALFAVASTLSGSVAIASLSKPNILLILADDLGYGDLSSFNPESKIPTPNLNRLARNGMRFTDAHAPGAVCIPSRYGLLTGRYPFRQDGNPSKGPLIESDRLTLASLLKRNGYRTAMFGKWHLGFEGGNDFDCAQPLKGGPVDLGFDTFFGLHASLDIPPYFYVQDDRCLAAPSEFIEANASEGWSPIQGAFWREGGIAPGFEHDEVLPELTLRTLEYIESVSDPAGRQGGPPFFVYLALAAPHTPWLPHEPFKGTSKAGMYGDFVVQVDSAIGEILHALDTRGLENDTLVIFTSDNGPVWYPEDTERFRHSSASIWRGMKGDVWEAGHRMPFIVHWPGKVQPGRSSNQLVGFTDLMATFADLLEVELPENAAEDSISFLPVLLGKEYTVPMRESLVMISSRKQLALRHGPWKYIPSLGSGGFTKPRHLEPNSDGPEGQLYRLDEDPSETSNLWMDQPAKVKELEQILEMIRNDKQ